MISANGGLPANRFTPQVTQRWPRGSEPASRLGRNTPNKKREMRCSVNDLGVSTSVGSVLDVDIALETH